MANIHVGEQVMNKQGEIGVLASADDRYVYVDYSGRQAKLQCAAFEQGFLRYLNPDLQNEVEASIASAQQEQEQQTQSRSSGTHFSASLGRNILGTRPTTQREQGVFYESVSVRLDPAPLTLNNVRKADKAPLQAVFTECEKDTQTLFERFQPKMVYPKYTSYSRSKYYVGFLTKYLDTYLFRVFARNDIYKKRMRTGVTVMESDTTEILRVIPINGRLYCLSKNLSGYNNSWSYNNWHVSIMGNGIVLNKVVRCCDCAYLNDYIENSDVNYLQFVHLLFPALHNNKAEIVFKHKLYASAYRIENIATYLDEFSSKQVDFACKHDALYALPLIKQYGVRDPDLLAHLETSMKPRRYSRSVYQTLLDILERLHLVCEDVGKRFIDFVRNVDYFNASLYYDYIVLLHRQPGVTLHDFFDRHYLERHDLLILEHEVRSDPKESEKYQKIAQELSWIDRRENGYYIFVPKTIDEFKVEGARQHNCVYTRGYFRSVINRESIIVFLREDPKISYVTIEYDYETFAVMQAYGKYNRRIDPTLYQYIVNLGKQLCNEMTNQE